MTTGLTAAGYAATTTAEEVDNFNALFLSTIDGGLDLSPDQPIGQLIAGFAERCSKLTQLAGTIYNMLNPSAAEGQFLVNTCALTGTHPQVATYSTVSATLNLNAGTTVFAGATASVTGQPGNVWVLTANAVNSGGSPANITGAFRSQVAGVWRANAGTLTVIGTPTAGWNTVTNAADSTDGLAADTDTTLRIKREQEIQGAGSSDTNAIRAKVLEVPGVIDAFVYENVTMLSNVYGPPKSFHVIVWDGAGTLADNTALATAIWGAKPAGILAFGGTAVTITDSTGNSQTVSFDRVTQVPLWVTCTTTPSSLTTAQTNAVKGAIKQFGDTFFTLGASVVARLFSACPLEPTAATVTVPAYVPFVTDVPVFEFDIHSSPTNTANIANTGFQIFTLDTTHMLVNGV